MPPIYIFYNLHNHSWLHIRHSFLREHRNDMNMKYVLSVLSPPTYALNLASLCFQEPQRPVPQFQFHSEIQVRVALSRRCHPTYISLRVTKESTTDYKLFCSSN